MHKHILSALFLLVGGLFGGTLCSASTGVAESSLVAQLYLWGSGSEEGASASNAHAVVCKDKGNQLFEIYTSIGDGELFLSEGNDESSAQWGTDEQGRLVRGLRKIVTDVRGSALLRCNLSLGELTVEPMTFAVLSNMLKGGWAGKTELPYIGNGTWGGEVLMRYATSETPRFFFRGNEDEALTLKRVSKSFNQLAVPGNAQGLVVEDIQVPYGNYRVDLDMTKASFSIVCRDREATHLAYMGSSVCHNMGATNNNGYTNQYTKLLAARAAQGGVEFSTVNVSIGGNNSKNLLDRWERDLTPTCSRYVMYGISLGNEGIRESSNKDAVFEQWRNNMLQLIAQAKERGMVPIVANNYTRADFTSVEHDYVKRMNLLIHEWDVASVNLLGAIDDGSGKWANGYMADGAHPNDAGHTEFFYAMVPSLIEAMYSGKEQPVIRMNTQLSFANENDGRASIKWVPENVLHPFAYSVECKTLGAGTLFTFTTTAGKGVVSIDEITGKLKYQSPNGQVLWSDKVVNDGAWHRVTLTHYHAWGETHLYADNNKAGRVVEKLAPTEFALHGADAPTLIAYRNLFAYRSALNELEVKALVEGRMLKSSLEIYASMDESQPTIEAQIMNSAQSLNSLRYELHTGSDSFLMNERKLLYDKEQSSIFITGMEAPADALVRIYSNDGRLVKSVPYSSSGISVSEVSVGSYILLLHDVQRQEYSQYKFIRH